MTSKRTRSGILFGFGKGNGKSEKDHPVNQQSQSTDSSMVKTKHSDSLNEKSKPKEDFKVNDLSELLCCEDDKEKVKVNLHKSESKPISSSSRSGLSDRNEILVSLLGGSGKPGHADKTKFGNASSPSASSKLLDIPTPSEEKVIQPRKGKDRKRCAAMVDVLDVHDCPSVTHPSIRIFSNNNPKPSAEILKMSNMPCETFLVSLSKDKSKELNMVKTTPGSRHVNSTQNQFLSNNYNFQDSFAKHASQSSGKCISSTSERKCCLNLEDLKPNCLG